MRLGTSLQQAVKKALTDVSGFIGRVDDMKFLLDHFGEIEAKFPALRGRLDANRIGIAGHSYGAYTAMLMAGARVNLAGHEKGTNFTDARPSAFLLLSPQGRSPKGDERGLVENSWKDITRPLFVLTGSRDNNTTGEGPEWRLEPVTLGSLGERWGFSLGGATHMTFTGLPAQGKGLGAPHDAVGVAFEKKLFAEVQMLTLQFWNATLRKDSSSREALLRHPGLITPSSGASALPKNLRASALLGVNIIANDGIGSSAFYARLLGVQPPKPKNDSEWMLPHGSNYLLIHAAPMAKRASAAPLGCTQLTLLFDELEPVLQRLREHGDSVPDVHEFMPGVRFATLKDPEGNLVELGSLSAEVAAQSGITIPGLMAGLHVSSIDEARAFFAECLGLPEQPSRPSPRGTRYAFGSGGFIKVWEAATAANVPPAETNAVTGFRVLHFAGDSQITLEGPDGLTCEIRARSQ